MISRDRVLCSCARYDTVSIPTPVSGISWTLIRSIPFGSAGTTPSHSPPFVALTKFYRRFVVRPTTSLVGRLFMHTLRYSCTHGAYAPLPLCPAAQALVPGLMVLTLSSRALSVSSSLPPSLCSFSSEPNTTAEYIYRTPCRRVVSPPDTAGIAASHVPQFPIPSPLPLPEPIAQEYLNRILFFTSDSFSLSHSLSYLLQHLEILLALNLFSSLVVSLSLLLLPFTKGLTLLRLSPYRYRTCPTLHTH